MTTRIPQRELRNNNAEILNRVAAGERFVVTRNGVAVADVIPHSGREGPPMFPKAADLTNRRTTRRPLNREAWLRDIRESDNSIDDDPLHSDA